MFIAFLAALSFAQPAAGAPAAPAANAEQPGRGAVARIRPSPELVAAYTAWGQCMDKGVASVPAEEAAAAAARRVVAGCSTQLKTVTTVGERWIVGLNLPAAQQQQLRAKLKQETSGLEQRVVARLAELRASARPVVVGR